MRHTCSQTHICVFRDSSIPLRKQSARSGGGEGRFPQSSLRSAWPCPGLQRSGQGSFPGRAPHALAPLRETPKRLFDNRVLTISWASTLHKNALKHSDAGASAYLGGTRHSRRGTFEFSLGVGHSPGACYQRGTVISALGLPNLGREASFAHWEDEAVPTQGPE